MNIKSKDKEELAYVERIVGVAKKNMLEALEAFRAESWDLKKMKQERNKEQELNNRLIKEAIFEMAQRVEDIQKAM